MLLPMLPGPETIFRPVHEKSSSNSGKISANFQPQILEANFSNFFFSQAPLKLYGRNFGHLETLAAVQPPIPPTSPFPSLPSLSPLPSLAALQLTAQLAKY
jgi:hypothetical protein